MVEEVVMVPGEAVMEGKVEMEEVMAEEMVVILVMVVAMAVAVAEKVEMVVAGNSEEMTVVVVIKESL